MSHMPYRKYILGTSSHNKKDNNTIAKIKKIYKKNEWRIYNISKNQTIKTRINV